MQLDGAAITIERRKMTGCIDLAVVFVREHFGAVAMMTLFFAVPSCLVTWLLASYTDVYVYASWILFAILSPILGAVLVIGAGRRVFGDEFQVGASFKTLRSRFWILFGYVFLTRLLGGILWCLILPPLLVIVRYGFVAETLFLESTPKKKVGSRVSNLMANVYSDLVGRSVTSLLFYILTAFGLFVIIELVFSILLGIPVVYGRLGGGGDLWDEFVILMLSDPWCITVFHAILWLVYPLIRLAWFFCYLDVRIQKEGWDVELDFRIEAQRLNGLA